ALTFADDGEEIWAAADGFTSYDRRRLRKIVPGGVVGLALAQPPQGITSLAMAYHTWHLAGLCMRRLSGTPLIRPLDEGYPNFKDEWKRRREGSVDVSYVAGVEVWSPNGEQFLRASQAWLHWVNEGAAGSDHGGYGMDSWDRQTGHRQNWGVSKDRE